MKDIVAVGDIQIDVSGSSETKSTMKTLTVEEIE
jgi:hypothetical protein